MHLTEMLDSFYLYTSIMQTDLLGGFNKCFSLDMINQFVVPSLNTFSEVGLIVDVKLFIYSF
jgi:hypothetical protein